MSQTIYVVTSVDLGWDCVIGVFSTIEAAENACKPHPDEAQWFKDEGYLNDEGMFDTHFIHAKILDQYFD